MAGVTTVTGRLWRNGEPCDEAFTFDAISDCLASDDQLVWADIYDPDHEALLALAHELHLNIWAVEDATAAAARSAPRVARDVRAARRPRAGSDVLAVWQCSRLHG